MKIGFFTEHATTNFGIGNHIQSLGAELKKRGHDVFLLTDDTVNENPGHIRIYQVSIPATARIRRLWRLFHAALRVIREEKPDVIHTHSYYDFYIATLVRFLYRIPVVHTLHSYVYSCPRNNRLNDTGHLCTCMNETECAKCVGPVRNTWKKIVRRLFLTLATRIIVLNQIEYSYFSSRSRKINLISNWVETSIFTPPLRREKTRNILFIGGFRPVKRFDIMLNAFIKLVQSNPAYRLLVAGDLDPKPSGLLNIDKTSFIKKIYKMIHDHGVSDKIEFLGVVPKLEMPGVFRRSDVFVSTSPTEVNPISFLESISCGTPVVAMVNPLNLDIPTVSASDLPDAIHSAMENGLSPELLDRVRHHYSTNVIVKKIERLYRQCAGKA